MWNTDVSRHCVAGGGAPPLCCARWSLAPDFQAELTSMCDTEVPRHCVAGGGAPPLCCARRSLAPEFQAELTSMCNTEVSRHCVAGVGVPQHRGRSRYCALWSQQAAGRSAVGAFTPTAPLPQP